MRNMRITKMILYNWHEAADDNGEAMAMTRTITMTMRG